LLDLIIYLLCHSFLIGKKRKVLDPLCKLTGVGSVSVICETLAILSPYMCTYGKRSSLVVQSKGYTVRVIATAGREHNKIVLALRKGWVRDVVLCWLRRHARGGQVAGVSDINYVVLIKKLYEKETQS
jgi:hypothetical protein